MSDCAKNSYNKMKVSSSFRSKNVCMRPISRKQLVYPSLIQRKEPVEKKQRKVPFGAVLKIQINLREESNCDELEGKVLEKSLLPLL